MAVYPIFYLGPIDYYACLIREEAVVFEVHENLPKQTFRNRCVVEVPNGLTSLTLPVRKIAPKMPVYEVTLSYREPWQKDHWRALTSTYRSSPFFEFYDYLFEPFYNQTIELLVDWNIRLHQTVMYCLQHELPHSFSTDFAPIRAQDYRTCFKAKQGPHLVDNPPVYRQVFAGERGVFYPNLSIVDLLFNLGPQAREYLQKLPVQRPLP